MSKEKFDYEEYVQNMYEQVLEIMPQDIGGGDKEYLATTVKQFFQMSAESMLNEYAEFGIDAILFAAQVIAEWTYHKGVDIIRAGIPKEYRNGLLQQIAFIAYEILKQNIKKGTSKELLLKKVEKDIKKNFYESINELCLRKCITEDIAKKAMELSNIDEQKNTKETKEQYESIKASNCIYNCVRDNLEEQFANNDENTAEIQKKNAK